jgi:hypothetical protein
MSLFEGFYMGRREKFITNIHVVSLVEALFSGFQPPNPGNHSQEGTT